MSIELATKIAVANPVQGLPRMAAVLTKRRKVVSVGMNSRKTHPLQQKFGKNKDALCIHAEIAAIKNALKIITVDELAECTLYVARVLKNNSVGLAKPCPGCASAIAEFNIKQVYWTDNG